MSKLKYAEIISGIIGTLKHKEMATTINLVLYRYTSNCDYICYYYILQLRSLTTLKLAMLLYHVEVDIILVWILEY